MKRYEIVQYLMRKLNNTYTNIHDVCNGTDSNSKNDFTADIEIWKNAQGQLRLLHEFNIVRLAYIKRIVVQHFHTSNAPANLQVLDVGAGGGLVCEPLARLGAQVCGIDPSQTSIAAAQVKAQKQGLIIEYARCVPEIFAETGRRFDIVLALEVLEHVYNQNTFLKACCALTKPDGCLIFSTLNQSWEAWLGAILGAEYVLQIVPRGTHTWKKFINPHVLVGKLYALGLSTEDITGARYNPLTHTWSFSNNTSINYFLSCTHHMNHMEDTTQSS